MRLLGRVQRRLGVGLARDVAADADAADFLGDLLGVFLVEIEAGDLGALGRHQPRRRRAEARAAAGDENRKSVEIHVMPLS